MAKCYQCSNPPMYLVTEKEIPLCLDCYLKFAQLTQAELESHERAMNFHADEIAFQFGMPSLGPRFPARPRPIHVAGVQMHNINVSNSVVGTINTGSIGVVDQSISALLQLHEPELARSLKEISEAILGSADLTANQKKELFESLSIISKEAAAPKEQRKNSVAIALLERAAQITGLAHDIADVCQKLWPILLAAFQAAGG